MYKRQILAYLCSTLSEPSGNKTGPSRSHRVRSLKSYRSRPPPYPRMWFGLLAYDTFRENAARSPCSFLVLRRGTAGQLLLVSLSPCLSCSRNHSGRPASTASLSTGKGTSCGPLMCRCYTRVAMHGRSFPSGRVIAVVLPLPSVLNVFPSVEPTTIVNICIQFACFEQK